MRLTRPEQISTNPEVDAQAMAAITGSFDSLERLFASINRIAFFQGTGVFAAAAATGAIAFTNLAALRLPNGTYATPKAALCGCGNAPVAGRIDIAITVTAVVAGGATVQLWTPGAAFTDNVIFWLLLIA